MMEKTPLLEVRNVTKIFKLGGIFFGNKIAAVEDANLILEQTKSKTLTLAGESGSGKTTLARIILGLLEPTKGKVLYKGRDIFRMNKNEKKNFRKQVQPIFQNPYESLNFLRKVDSYLRDTALNFGIASNENVEDVISEALEIVGLRFKEIRGRYPHELSGGQLQRVAIARALITKPRILVADEPVSMVDASSRMGILNLFLELKKKFGTNIIYITHDLATAYYMGDEIAIMYRGNIVEYGSVEKVLTQPLHPYTHILLQSIPEPDPFKRWSEEIKLSSLEVKEFQALGCKFADRCPQATDKCREKRPPTLMIEDRLVKCWLYSK